MVANDEIQVLESVPTQAGSDPTPNLGSAWLIRGLVAPRCYSCPEDGQPCGPLQVLPDTAEQLPSGWVAALPCAWCPRHLQRRVQALPRLGKLARRILLEAPPPEEQCAVIAPPASGRSAEEANRRAIRSLCHAQLLVAGSQSECREIHWRSRDGILQQTRRKVSKRAVCLSPLGQAVVELLRDDLQMGRPIRWGRHREALQARAQEDEKQLLDRLRTRLGEMSSRSDSCRDQNE
jgi:hypothetical protein